MAAKSLLLVEGNDDKHVLWQLLEHHSVPESFEVKDQGGVDNEFQRIVDILDVVVDQSELEVLGIIVDANADPASRWGSLRDRLASRGYDLPHQPSTDGTIVEKAGGLRIGVWLMPDNANPGMLEDFVVSLGASSDPLWARAEMCLDEIPPEQTRFRKSYRIKAHVHTWLAWQEDPGRPLGHAIKVLRSLDADAQPAQNLIAWVRRLFVS